MFLRRTKSCWPLLMNFRRAITTKPIGLNSCDPSSISSLHQEGLGEVLLERLRLQRTREKHGVVLCRSVLSEQSTGSDDECVALDKMKEEWKSTLIEAIRQKQVDGKAKDEQTLTMAFRLFTVLPAEELAEITCAEALRQFCFGRRCIIEVPELCAKLGQAVILKLVSLQLDKAQINAKLDEMYVDCLRHNNLCDSSQWSELSSACHRVHFSDELSTALQTISFTDRRKLGDILLKLLLKYVKINNKPVFRQVNQPGASAVKLSENAEAHRLADVVSERYFCFDTMDLPMLTPPLPWLSTNVGGFLEMRGPFVRSKEIAVEESLIRNSSLNLDTIFSALTVLGSVSWKINEKILDVVLSVFSKPDSLDNFPVPLPESAWPQLPSPTPNQLRKANPQLSKADYDVLSRQFDQINAKRHMLRAQYVETKQALTVAQHFQQSEFWFPCCIDFRGRVQVCANVLTHMGNDLSRALLQFSEGRQLGPKQDPHDFSGLDWLGIHCANLTGLLKGASLLQRLEFAKKNVANIIAVAQSPLTERWWLSSANPWQTLATCMEIHNALKSENPESFVSHLPVHQDGTSNALQHYVALTLDETCAADVNLAKRGSADAPGDVYVRILEAVENRRRRDATSGCKEAIILNGFANRQIVKDCVVAYVFGRSTMSMKHQLKSSLEAILPVESAHGSSEMSKAKPDFDSVAEYLVKLVQTVCDDLMKRTFALRDWLHGIAETVSADLNCQLEWTTPLGLRVVQPYTLRNSKKDKALDVKKQTNAFAPNFVHSLESSHLLLTAMQCSKDNVTFAAVHDSFWTHAATVNAMNEVCRDQFVRLYQKNDILNDLATQLCTQHPRSSSLDESQRNSVEQLHGLANNIPKKGNFDLQEVHHSAYFFS